MSVGDDPTDLALTERCRSCGVMRIVGRIHCGSCGAVYEDGSVELAENEVDEASIESFPASDPPGW